jgi:hypothetical protein
LPIQKVTYFDYQTLKDLSVQIKKASFEAILTVYILSAFRMKKQQI